MEQVAPQETRRYIACKKVVVDDVEGLIFVGKDPQGHIEMVDSIAAAHRFTSVDAIKQSATAGLIIVDMVKTPEIGDEVMVLKTSPFVEPDDTGGIGVIRQIQEYGDDGAGFQVAVTETDRSAPVGVYSGWWYNRNQIGIVIG